MRSFTFRSLIFALASILLAARTALGIAGVSPVASEGKPVAEDAGWPAKIIDLVNDPVRTVGWNEWFSELPNDVYQYAFAAKSTDDLNRLIKKLAATKAKGATVELSLGKEYPTNLLSILKPGNNIPAVVRFGNQVRLNQWYGHLKESEPGVKQFGARRYTETPTALAPTLTIYVENAAVDLEKLEIPAEISVVARVSKEDREKRTDDEALKAIDRLLEKRQQASELR
jgi:hypothetical protein